MRDISPNIIFSLRSVTLIAAYEQGLAMVGQSKYKTSILHKS